MTRTGPQTLVLDSGGSRLCIDVGARSVYVNDEEVHFTRTEFDVLAYLASRLGQAVRTQELIASVWGDWYGPVDHVNVHMHHIRRKLGPCSTLLQTKRSVGYVLRTGDVVSGEAVPWLRVTQEYLDLLQRDARSRGIIWLIVDQHRHVSWVSDSLATLLGWTSDDLVGKLPWVIAHEDDVGIFVSHFPVRGGTPRPVFDARVHRADGNVVRLHVNAQVLIGLDGLRLGGIGEWSLPKGEFDVASSTAGEWQAMPFVLHYDADHVLTGVEPRQAFLGWQPDEVIGTHFSLAGLDHMTTRAVMDGLVRVGPEHALGPTAAKRADGTAATVGIRLRLVLEDGTLTRYSGEVHVLD